MDKTQDKEKSPHKHEARIVSMPDSLEHRLIKPSSENNAETIQNNLNAIKTRYTDFDLHQFIEGAKGAYDMILESFNHNLPEDIKDYLGTNIYEEYKKLFTNYQDKNYTYNIIVTRIEKASVISATTTEAKASIQVEFHAQNISFLKDADDAIIDGNQDTVKAVTDIWTFERSYSATDAKWIVTDIS